MEVCLNEVCFIDYDSYWFPKVDFFYVVLQLSRVIDEALDLLILYFINCDFTKAYIV